MSHWSADVEGSGTEPSTIPKPLPKGKKQCFALQALQYGGEMTVEELALAHRLDRVDPERGVGLARVNPTGERTKKGDRNSMHRSLRSLLEGTDVAGPWVERQTGQTPHKYKLIPVDSNGSPRTVRHSLMDGLATLIDAKLSSRADRQRINEVAKTGTFGDVVSYFAGATGMGEIDIRFRIAGVSQDKTDNVYEEQFNDRAWRWFATTRVADIRDKARLVSENRPEVAAIGMAIVLALVLYAGVGVIRYLQQPQTERIDTIDVAETPAASTTSRETGDEPPLLEEQATRLTVAENAIGVVPRDGDLTIVWDGPGGAPGEQPVMASLTTNEPIRSVTGRLTLKPGDDPDIGQPGGASIHVYAQPTIGEEGGQEAQVLLLNAAQEAELGGATGICTTGECYGTGDGYVSTDLTGIDSTDGVDFEFTATGAQLTLTIRSVNDPTTPAATITAPFEGKIQAISLDIWGTQWPFVANLTDLTIDYEN